MRFGVSGHVLLSLAVVLVTISLIVGCAGAPAPTPTTAPKPATAPTTAPAPAPATAATAPKPVATPTTAPAPAAAQPSSASQPTKVYKVGISQIVEHAALVDLVRGFKDGMKDLGYVEGKNIEYEMKNAQGEIANTTAIAKQFVNAKKDLIYGVGTPNVIAAAKETKDIPVLFVAMTDPVAAGVVKSLEKPGGNVTGNSDWVDPVYLLKTLKEALPDIKSVGTIFNPSEANSNVWVDALVSGGQTVGLKIVKMPVANTGEIQVAAQSLMNQVDVVFQGPDNTVGSGIEVLAKVALSAKKPTASWSETDVDRGILLTLVLDNHKLGVMTARQADLIFKGKSPADIPVERVTDPNVAVNTKTAEAIGVKIADSVMARAKKVSK